MFRAASLGSLRGTPHDLCYDIITRDGGLLGPIATEGNNGVNLWID